MEFAEYGHYIADNFPMIARLAMEHAALVFIAVGLAIVTGVPIGILITQNRKVANTVIYIASVVITIPSIALFGIMIPILSMVGQGIGALPAIIAVLLYSQLPIIRNTYTAVENINPAMREAARGIGMTHFQRLRWVEIPNALPVIMAGVRTAVVMSIGIMAIATYIGAGGLGSLISRGISQSDPRQLIVGSAAVSLLAIFADQALAWLQTRLTPKGSRAEN